MLTLVLGVMEAACEYKNKNLGRKMNTTEAAR